MSDGDVLFERRGRLGLITLNRPKALNALTHAMCVDMKAKLDEWAGDPEIWAVTIRGEGDRAFCAGGDIRVLYDSGRAGTPYAFEFYRDEYRLNATVKHFPKPYIALLRGIVMGGGVGVSVHGSHRVADDTAVFAMPETGIGLFPDVGGSYFLPRCPGETGMYLALTGARLKAADMLYAGVATHRVSVGKNGDLLEGLTEGESPDNLLAALAETSHAPPLREHREAIDCHFSAPSVEAVLAGLDKEDSDWARATAASVRSKSPTALKLAHRQLRTGRYLDFDACMRMEMRMVARVIQGHDFYEGVRATIIEKDNAPKWRPPALSEVVDRDIDQYFSPLHDRELVL
jgi:enoyl-CoA hydratase